MSDIILSVIIPSYRDPLLNKTIESLLTHSQLGAALEVIAVFDGYWGVPINDPRVRYVHLGRNRGMRGAINAGVAISRGKFIMRTDEHCEFATGYDKVLTDACQPNWIVTPKRYFLDPVQWKVMDIPPIEIEKLVIQDNKKFSAQTWKSRSEEKKHEVISETMAMQGSCWLMPRRWWKKAIGELQIEGYGQLIQDSHEMVFKTWKLGGKLMVVKNTWFAHKHRSFPRTHNNGTKENPANQDAGYAYALQVWKDYYLNEIKLKWGI